MYCGNNNLSELSCPYANNVLCNDNALSKEAIEVLLYGLYLNGKLNGTIDISGGSNALYGNWTTDALNYYSVLVLNRGWTILYND